MLTLPRLVPGLLLCAACASSGVPTRPLAERPTALLEPLFEFGELRRRVERDALPVCDQTALGVVTDACDRGWRVVASAPSDGRVDFAYFADGLLLTGFAYYVRVSGSVVMYGEDLYGCGPSPARTFFCVPDPRTPPK